MKEAMNRADTVVAVRHDGPRRLKMRASTRCSICAGRIWWKPIHLMEPESVSDPRLSWVLCKPCYQAVLHQMRTSPIRTPLRLRIAMGMVAAERWPQAYPTRVRTYISDRRWIIFIAVGFIIAMIVHLALIVMIASMMP